MGAVAILAPSLLWLAIVSAAIISIGARPENLSCAEGSLPIPAARQDLTNHPWYTYIFNDLGDVTHYFVSIEVPVNSCAISSLDGGSGDASVCNGWIFTDAATGGLGMAHGMKIMTFDAPLLLETEPTLIQPTLAE